MIRPARRTSRAAVVLALIAAGLLAGCAAGGGAGPTGAARGTVQTAGDVRIVVRDNSFEPKSVRVRAGQPATVTFVNEGKNVHEVEIKGLVKETKLLPGESRQFTITPGQTTYKLYCEIHEDSGMTGEFVGE